jgi:hypothetical protein
MKLEVMAVLVLAALVVMFGGQPLLADSYDEVTSVKSAQYAGAHITAVAPVELDAGATTVYTDAMAVPRAGAFSVGVMVSSTETVALTLAVQVSWDNTNWVTKASPEMNITATQLIDVETVTLPLAPLVRVGLSSDATYPVTYENVVLNAR